MTDAEKFRHTEAFITGTISGLKRGLQISGPDAKSEMLIRSKIDALETVLYIMQNLDEDKWASDLLTIRNKEKGCFL